MESVDTQEQFDETFEDICSSITKQAVLVTEKEKNLCLEAFDEDHLSLGAPQPSPDLKSSDHTHTISSSSSSSSSSSFSSASPSSSLPVSPEVPKPISSDTQPMQTSTLDDMPVNSNPPVTVAQQPPEAIQKDCTIYQSSCEDANVAQSCSPAVKQPLPPINSTYPQIESPATPDFTPFKTALQNFANLDIGVEEKQAALEIFDPFIQTLVARGSLAMPAEVAGQFQALVKPFLWTGTPSNQEVNFTKAQVAFFQKCLAIMWVQGDVFQQFYGKEETVTKSEYFRINGFYLQSENEKRVLFQQLQNNQNIQSNLLDVKEKLSLELSQAKSQIASLKQEFEAVTDALKKCNTDKKSVTEVNRLLASEGSRLGSTCGASAAAARVVTPSEPPRPSPSSAAAPSPESFPAPPSPKHPLPTSAPASNDPFHLSWPPETNSEFQPSDRHLLVNIITVYPDADFFNQVKIKNDLKIVSKVLQGRAKIFKSIPTFLHPALKKVDHGSVEPIQAFSALLYCLAEARSTPDLLEFLRKASPQDFNRKEKTSSKYFLLPFTLHTDPWARMLYSATRQRPDKEATLYLMSLLSPGLYQAITRLQSLKDPPSHVDKLVTSLDPVTPHQTLLNVAITLVTFYQLQFENNKNLGYPPVADSPKMLQPSSGFFDCNQLQALQKMTHFPVSLINLHANIKTDFAAPGAFASARLDEAQALQEIFHNDLQECSPQASSSAKKQRRFPPPPRPLLLPLFRPSPRPRLPYYPMRPPFGPRF